MAAKKSGGGIGGFLFAAFIAAVAWQPALAGIAVVIGILWLVFASNAKFGIGNNPELMKTGQRGHVDVVMATRSQVRSRSGNGPWQNTWTIVLEAQPPHAVGFRVTTYRKIPERAGGPSTGQRYAAWFAKGAPQTFHIDWNAYSASAAQTPAEQPRQQPRPQQRQQPRQQPRPAQQPRRSETPAYQLPEREEAPLPMVEAEGGYGFDFAAHGVDARGRIDDYGAVDDGSTELALTVMPRGRPAYRTIVNAYVPVDRRHVLARGASLKVRIDPSRPGRLTIVG
ncbi:MAG: hypothetical protein QM698_15590 [Micropepsaceae bacterium]